MGFAIRNWRLLLFAAVGLFSIVFILVFDRKGRVAHMIHEFGWFGVVLAILLMALICLTPIPSEGLLLMYLNIFGISWGLVLSWGGSAISTAIIFVISRYFGNFMLRRAMKHKRFAQVNDWVSDRGSFGLLMARLLPVPAFVVNYAAGMVPSINFWTYFWTGVVSLIPYYLASTLFYLGLSTHWWWALIALVPAFSVGGIGYLVRIRKRNVWSDTKFR